MLMRCDYLEEEVHLRTEGSDRLDAEYWAMREEQVVVAVGYRYITSVHSAGAVTFHTFLASLHPATVMLLKATSSTQLLPRVARTVSQVVAKTELD